MALVYKFVLASTAVAVVHVNYTSCSIQSRNLCILLSRPYHAYCRLGGVYSVHRGPNNVSSSRITSPCAHKRVYGGGELFLCPPSAGVVTAVSINLGALVDGVKRVGAGVRGFG